MIKQDGVRANSPFWERDFYKRGYEGFERLETFPSDRDLADYRRLLLEKSQAQVAFIRRHLGAGPLHVLEFGAGNGRLLVGLALGGMLAEGLGLEIAASRVAFARRWAEDLHLPQFRPVQADVLECADFPAQHFDLAACITGAFNYFRPIEERAPLMVLRKLHAALRPGGFLLLELYTLPQHRAQMLSLNGGRLRVWQPLPPADRFAYYLDDFEYWAESHILRHEKIFIGRDGGIDAGRVEVLAYYSASELLESLLVPAGFGDIHIYGDFEDTAYDGSDTGSLVVLARKGVTASG